MSAPPEVGSIADLRSLAAAADAVDGGEPFSEQTWLSFTAGGPEVVHLGKHLGDELIGYAQVRGDGSTELAVHPAHRRRGHGRALLDSAAAVHPDLRVWSYTAHPGAAALAGRTGLVVIRELWRMERSLPLGPEADHPGPVELPPGVTVRQFRPGSDDSAWLALNAKAFAEHGEQGRLTLADLTAREQTDWFDPAGFFLAERAGELVGFHWTKEHRAENAGEIYVLGVDPDFHGGGLGRALSRIGLRHLAQRGLPRVLLHVDADNAAAVRVYERLGFRTAAVTTMYGRPQLREVPEG
ncbi:MAG TPA: mycothiol synthase [Sporichthyaceae bacterium]|nr:mycothiol synthase [Sporichthyaceae bacterium]